MTKVKNKSWDTQNHPIKKIPLGKSSTGDEITVEINVGTYWGCRNTDVCDAEFLISEVPKPDDGLCLECRHDMFTINNQNPAIS